MHLTGIAATVTVLLVTTNCLAQVSQPPRGADAQVAAAATSDGTAAQGPRFERLLFPMHHLDPATVAERILALFNNGAAPPVTAVSVPGSNFLLLSAPAETLKEIVKILDQLDHQPRMITIDVWFVNLQPEAPKGAEGAATRAG